MSNQDASNDFKYSSFLQYDCRSPLNLYLQNSEEDIFNLIIDNDLISQLVILSLDHFFDLLASSPDLITKFAIEKNAVISSPTSPTNPNTEYTNGGVGSCGRELCCTTWVTNFVSVTTNSARTQELSLNPLKLAGQCGKLKCCLNFELTSYLDARKDFPDTNIPLIITDGKA